MSEGPLNRDGLGQWAGTELRMMAAAAKAATAEWLPKLAAITDPLSLKILELHGYETGYHEVVCVGCDVDGYEAEQPPWPCRTVRLVAEHHGMPAPEWVEFDE